MREINQQFTCPCGKVVYKGYEVVISPGTIGKRCKDCANTINENENARRQREAQEAERRRREQEATNRRRREQEAADQRRREKEALSRKIKKTIIGTISIGGLIAIINLCSTNNDSSLSTTNSPSTAQPPVTAIPQQLTLTPPSNVRTGSISTNSVSLHWDSVGSGRSYRVYFHTQNNSANAGYLSSTSTTFTVPSLASNTTYYFWVATVQDNQVSVLSPVQQATTTRQTETTPSAPTPQQNTSFDQARTITSGTTTNATLQVNVSHYYRIQAGAGTLTVYTTGNIDTEIWLYNSNRNQLQYDDDSGANSNARISRTVSAGTYFIRVGGYRNASGAYALYVSLQPTQTSTQNQNSSSPQTSLAGTTWEYINQSDSGNRYRLSFSGSDSVTFEIYSSNGSRQLEKHNGTYTLQGNSLAVAINYPEGRITDRFTFTAQTSIVNNQNRAIVYRPR
jgi:hypothetical protein